MDTFGYFVQHFFTWLINPYGIQNCALGALYSYTRQKGPAYVIYSYTDIKI